MRRLALLVAILPLCAARSAIAQAAPGGGGTCELQYFARTPGAEPRVNAVRQPSGAFNYFIGGGVVARCPAQSMTLEADSAEYYGDSRTLFLIYNVHYTEPRATLDAARLTYFMPEERIYVEGDVRASLPSGTTMRGPAADYFRAVPRLRPRARLVAIGRPTINLVQRDSVTGQPAPPTEIVANTVVMDGDSLAFASGRVVITRTDVIARGDSAALDQGREWARLMRRPSIDGRGERPFTLSGTVIDLFARNRALERVLSMGSARVVSQDMTLTSDTLDFRMQNALLQRAHAWGRSRARAVSPAYDIVSDSMDVHMPAQRLRQVFAVRDAHAQSRPDTTRIRTTDRDWMRGDTIIGSFEDPPSSDTAARPRIRELIAKGSARSYYHLAQTDTVTSTPALNYVIGGSIAVAFANQQVQTVTVSDQATGAYLTPRTAADTVPTESSPTTPARTTPPAVPTAPPTPTPRPGARP
ncbi:MAG TPA: hypothetical protein VJ672_13235 [Gemmatimonadaceae bacterium]|nr:hypothetical protein [Gemmatimonadaceae bacterium]